jgi:hypothetical protein
MGAFHFVALAALRAAQLTRGCVPRAGGHTTAAVARREVAEGKVLPLVNQLTGRVTQPGL